MGLTFLTQLQNLWTAVPPQYMKTRLQRYTKELSNSGLNSSGHGEFTTYQDTHTPKVGRSS